MEEQRKRDSALDSSDKLYCNVCGNIDEHYDENANVLHAATPKHICNLILSEYRDNKHAFSKNRDGISVYCHAEVACEGSSQVLEERCAIQKIRIYAKPNEVVQFSFEVCNDQKQDIMIVGMHLAHPQPQFVMNDHPYRFGEKPHVLAAKSRASNPVLVTFRSAEFGEHEMPIMFTFQMPKKVMDKPKTDVEKLKKKTLSLVIVREMVIHVQDERCVMPFRKSPFVYCKLLPAEHFIQSTAHAPYEVAYKIPKPLKQLFPMNLEENGLLKLKISVEEREKLRAVLVNTRTILDIGITEDIYIMYYHYLLWWEEVISRINLKKYNMTQVKLELNADGKYWLEVPGLAEKRPSLLRGDRALIRLEENHAVIFESIIEDVRENSIQLGKLDAAFGPHYNPDTLFNVRFLMCRVPMERMHEAVSKVFSSGQGSRVFPKPVGKAVAAQRIKSFFNPLIGDNPEQRSAVEHILSRTSGLAPYIVFGPPGTGKTMTIVEAILQTVKKNSKNRILVCTDSNMAADHVAMKLLEYNRELQVNRLLLRANSFNREWTIMPAELVPVSNGSSMATFQSLHNEHVATFRVVVTTLMHAAKYSSDSSQYHHNLKMTHVFIDEAAQAKEPAALVPVTGLLAQSGQLVLAGDPQQLGPFCMSRQASKRGLGHSLLSRLYITYKDLYSDSNYITTLVNNFRSHPDILRLPNQLFYENILQVKASLDPLSDISVLGLAGGERAVVFHSVNSREQRMGSAPSYFNEKELFHLQKYTLALIHSHGVSPKDIGIIAPYIRQVYKMRDWLRSNKYSDVEIGTVEAFQGKEKRVILVSTVRANCHLLDYDARYSLGFLTDDKRFNVALTRAKAKLIIIGNAACLDRDIKWRMYMGLCKDFNSYHGKECEQLPRDTKMLVEVARTRFDRCGMTEALAARYKNKERE